MTVVSIASFLQDEAHPAHSVRRMTQSAFGGRPGVIPQTATFTDLKVTQRGAGANMSVDVAEGSCIVIGTESTYQGVYHCENQGVQNVTIAAADATNPRRDMIVARIKDTEYGVAVTDEFVIERVAGTPAGSPVDPTIPSNCVVLARVAVAAAASSITNANITDLRNGYAAVTGSAIIGNQVKASGLGGVVSCTSSFRPTKGLYDGLVIYETDTNLIKVYDGTSWTTTQAAARAYATSGSAINGTITTNVDTTDFLRGGFTHTTSPQYGLIAPVSGVYQVNGNVKLVPSAAGTSFAAGLFVNGTLVRYGDQALVSASSYESRNVADLISLTAADRVSVGYVWGGATTAFQNDGPGLSNYLSVALVCA